MSDGKRVLAIFERPVYGNMESTDVGLFASTYAPVAGVDLAILLRGGAVHYAVAAQDSEGIEILGHPIPVMNVARDLALFVESGTPVYVVGSDLKARGIAPEELIAGVTVVDGDGVAELQELGDLILVW